MHLLLLFGGALCSTATFSKKRIKLFLVHQVLQRGISTQARSKAQVFVLREDAPSVHIHLRQVEQVPSLHASLVESILGHFVDCAQARGRAMEVVPNDWPPPTVAGRVASGVTLQVKGEVQVFLHGYIHSERSKALHRASQQSLPPSIDSASMPRLAVSSPQVPGGLFLLTELIIEVRYGASASGVPSVKVHRNTICAMEPICQGFANESICSIVHHGQNMCLHHVHFDRLPFA
mmetsp:Transcript_53814/g.128201  ORF Transcript_53814/g.128201 Transcript_53814/m.128201 type:complete len:234 (-) Transcript_53814:188-889(-)